MRRTLLVALFATSVACEPGPTPCEEAALHEPALVLGVGEDSFVELQDGDQLPTVSGPQGGEHVPVAFRTKGIDPGARRFGGDVPGPRIAFVLTGDGVEIGWGDTNEAPLRGDPAGAELLDQQLFLDWFDPGDYQAYTLEVDLEDSCGTALAEEREVSFGG